MDNIKNNVNDKDVVETKDGVNKITKSNMYVDYILLTLFISSIVGYFLPLIETTLLSKSKQTFSSFELLMMFSEIKKQKLEILFFSAISLPLIFIEIGIFFILDYFIKKVSKNIGWIFYITQIIVGFHIFAICLSFGGFIILSLYNQLVSFQHLKSGFYFYALPFATVPLFLAIGNIFIHIQFIWKALSKGFQFLLDILFSKNFDENYPNVFEFSKINNLKGTFLPNWGTFSDDELRFRNKINDLLFILFLVLLITAYFLPLIIIPTTKYNLTAHFFLKNEKLIQSIPYLKEYSKEFLIPAMLKELIYLGSGLLVIKFIGDWIIKNNTIVNCFKVVSVFIIKLALLVFSIFIFSCRNITDDIKLPDTGVNLIDKFTKSIEVIELGSGFYILLACSIYYLMMSLINIIIWFRIQFK